MKDTWESFLEMSGKVCRSLLSGLTHRPTRYQFGLERNN